MAFVLVGSTLAIAAPASATHEDRCKDDPSGVIHDTCNAATCPLFEPVFQCIGQDPPEIGPCDGTNEVGVTIDGTEACITIEDCSDDDIGVVVGGSEICVPNPQEFCVIFEEPFRSICEGGT